MEAFQFQIMAVIFVGMLFANLSPQRFRLSIFYFLYFVNAANSISLFYNSVSEQVINHSKIFIEIPGATTIDFSFSAPPAIAFIWMIFSILALMTSSFFRNFKNEQLFAYSTPLSYLALAVILFSQNVFGIYFGWVLLGLTYYLEVSLNAAGEHGERAQSNRYIVPILFCDLLLLVGILGIVSANGSAQILELQPKLAQYSTQNSSEGWILLALLGVLGKGFQFPATFLQDGVNFLKQPMRVIFGISILFAQLVFLGKLLAPVINSFVSQIIVILPAISALIAGMGWLSALKNENKTQWLYAYIIANAIISFFTGRPDISILTIVTGAIVLAGIEFSEMLLNNKVANSEKMHSIAYLMLTAAPIGSLGWVRYSEYLGMMTHEGELSTIHWFVFFIKVVADILIGIGAITFARDYWDEEFEIQPDQSSFDQKLFTFFAMLSATSICLGGRIFAGWAGEEFENIAPGFHWFERYVLPAWHEFIKAAPVGEINSDLDYAARGVVLLVLILSVGISFWLLGDDESSTRTRKKISGIFDSFFKFGPENIFWEQGCRRFGVNLANLFGGFDRMVFERFQGVLFELNAKIFRGIGVIAETKVFEGFFVKAVSSESFWGFSVVENFTKWADTTIFCNCVGATVSAFFSIYSNKLR